ncbi:MAG: Transglutaminase-like superfamily [Actinomycetota bacterium]
MLDSTRRWPPFSGPEALRALRVPARALRANCLTQSVALTVAFERANQNPTLVLGCRRYENRKWGAHAWVIVGSDVFDAIPSGAHEPLARLTAETEWVPAPMPPKRQAD